MNARGRVRRAAGHPRSRGAGGVVAVDSSVRAHPAPRSDRHRRGGLAGWLVDGATFRHCGGGLMADRGGGQPTAAVVGPCPPGRVASCVGRPARVPPRPRGGLETAERGPLGHAHPILESRHQPLSSRKYARSLHAVPHGPRPVDGRSSEPPGSAKADSVPGPRKAPPQWGVFARAAPRRTVRPICLSAGVGRSRRTRSASTWPESHAHD